MKPEETRDAGSLHFHYSREDREAGLSARVRERMQHKGILKGNRSLVITLIDILVLLLLFGLVYLVGRNRIGSDLLPGFSVTSQAVSFQNNVFVTIKIKATKSDASAGNVQAMVSFPDLTSQQELLDLLPEQKGVTRELRASLPLKAGQKDVRIELKTKGHSKVYTVRIKQL